MRKLTIIALAWLTCGAGCVRSDTPVCTPTTVERLKHVPVPAKFTDPLPVNIRTDGKVGSYQDQAEINTATLQQCNVHRAATATLKPPTDPED